MIRMTVLLGCVYAIGAQALYSFPFHLPTIPPSKEAPVRDGNTLPPPFEGKYFRVTGQTGMATVEISGHSSLPDTTIVTDVSDIVDTSGSGNYTHFSDGVNLTYDSNGELIDSASYQWNESDSSVTFTDEDTTITFFYTGTEHGMSLAIADTSWTTTEDDGLGGTFTTTYSLENFSVLFTEISDPTNPVLFPGAAVGKEIRVQSSREGVLFTGELLEQVVYLVITDVNGRRIANEDVPFGRKKVSVSFSGNGVYIYQIVGSSGVLSQGRIVVRH